MAMKELVELIAKALVDDPSAVAVEVIESDGAAVVELRVAPADLGKVIGRQGRTARSMRTILAAVGTKRKVRAVLEILE
jgi:predicted RNA-binding protein YlqC (UPF0109 family)